MRYGDIPKHATSWKAIRHLRCRVHFHLQDFISEAKSRIAEEFSSDGPGVWGDRGMSDILSILHNHIVQLIGSGGLVLLFVSAYIQHMPDALPASWGALPQWLWGWNCAALKAFMNARAGATVTHLDTSVTPLSSRTISDSASVPAEPANPTIAATPQEK